MSKAKQHRTDIPLMPKESPNTGKMVDVYSNEKTVLTFDLNVFDEQNGRLKTKRELVIYPQTNSIPSDLWEKAKQMESVQWRLDHAKLVERAIKPDPQIKVIKREIWVNEMNERDERVLLTE